MNFHVKNITAGLLLAGMAGLTACGGSGSSSKTETTDSSSTSTTTISTFSLPDAKGFQVAVDSGQADLFVLKNKNGVQAAITSFGGRLVSLVVPDKDGKMTDVVVGFDSVSTYQGAGDYFGALIGRYGNRIGKAKFTLDGKEYKLPANNGPNTLHGGTVGFDSHLWAATKVGENALELTYTSKDGDQGFPGDLSTKVIYTLGDDNSLKIAYEATTTKPTVVNLTNHAYWNLNGFGTGTILDHTLQIAADGYTPVDVTLIPTGKIEKVEGTPFDFRGPEKIGTRIEQANEQLKNGKGYDHNYVLNKHDITTPITTLTGDKTGITMQVFTEEPGIQFYSGNFMQGKHTLKGGKAKNDFRTGLCLETQHYPDSPNKPEFPTTTLKPGATYKTSTIYKFTAN
ncbi:aldose epimerase family protein [Mucilaginibacter myungsuensis]|nr:aldose epimerase family protein [Mucilaginibacter myungsuensis]MDN3600525.1 aldose epimerase family protein [Mucilaginibacter myungsuensis]